MWPRSQEEKERNRNSAFISFMKRSDAEKALKAMDGKELHGHLLRVCWGKAVPIPAQPIFCKSYLYLALNSYVLFNVVLSSVGARQRSSSLRASV
jgi:U2-associated protein SR140